MKTRDQGTLMEEALKQARILVVDDQEENVLILERMLHHEGYNHLRSTTDSRKVLSLFNEFLPDLILLDLMMPYLDGYAVMEQLKPLIPSDSYLPILVLTADITLQSKLKALSAGAKDFLTKPFGATEVLLRIRNLLETRFLHLELQNQSQVLEEKVRERTGQLFESEARYRALVETSPDGISLTDLNANFVFCNQQTARLCGFETPEAMYGLNALELIVPEGRPWATENWKRVLEAGGARNAEYLLLRKDGSPFPAEIYISVIQDAAGNRQAIMGIIRDITERRRTEEKLQRSYDRLRQAMEETIQAMAMTVERRDPYTAGHQRRVAHLAHAIATEMSLSEAVVSSIKTAAAIHDLGKISVPAEILSKPGRISEAEFEIIKIHPQVGSDILKTIDFPWPLAQIVLQHHERMNGSGYPSGLSGQDILLEARILHVADLVEAMSSHRPYRPARGIDIALKEISENRGVYYDPGAVDACLNLFVERGFVLE